MFNEDRRTLRKLTHYHVNKARNEKTEEQAWQQIYIAEVYMERYKNLLWTEYKSGCTKGHIDNQEIFYRFESQINKKIIAVFDAGIWG